MVESIAALVLFSVMLMLYLPAFIAELNRQQVISQQTEDYRIFYELAAMYYNQPLSKSETLIEYRDLSMHGRLIESFRSSKEGCQIKFVDGEYINVSKH